MLAILGVITIWINAHYWHLYTSCYPVSPIVNILFYVMSTIFSVLIILTWFYFKVRGTSKDGK